MVKRERDDFYILKWLDEFMEGHKGFIAGGCFKNIFSKEKVKDIDIFFENEKDWYKAVGYFDSMTVGYEGTDKRREEYLFYYENEKVKAYKHVDKGIVVELISKKYGSPKSILSDFDFTISKFCYYKETVEDEEGKTHIEYKILHHENYFEHLFIKRLVIDDKIIFPTSTFERMIRYIGYGYKPCKETKLKIMMAINDEDPKGIAVAESLYDGLD